MLNVTLDITQDGETLTSANACSGTTSARTLRSCSELNVEVLLTDPAIDPLSMVGREIRFTSSDEPFHSQLRGISALAAAALVRTDGRLPLRDPHRAWALALHAAA